MKKFLVVMTLLGPGLAWNPGAFGQALHFSDELKDFPRSQLQINGAARVTTGPTSSVRAAYSALAAAGGVNVIVDTTVSDSVAAPIHIENATVFSAFDLLAAQAGTFVEVLDSKTVIVAPQTQAKHQAYDTEVLQTFYLANGESPQGISQILTALRKTLNARYLAQNTQANAVLLRGTPDLIAQAGQIISTYAPFTPGAPMAMIATGTLLTLQNGQVQDVTPVRSAIHPTNTSLVSLTTTGSARSLFQALASASGLNVVFDVDFGAGPTVSYKTENANVVDALDLLAVQSGSFWQSVDGNTVLVAQDVNSKHYKLNQMVAKTFYFPSTTTRTELVELTVAVRTMLNARYIATLEGEDEVVIRETPARMALVDKLVSDLCKSNPPAVSDMIAVGPDQNAPLNQTVLRAATAPVSLDLNATSRGLYETVAKAAGLAIVFDNGFQDSPSMSLNLQNVNPRDALDFVSIQSGNIWAAVDDRTVVVAPDSPAAHTALQHQVVRTLDLHSIPKEGANDVVTALRTILNIRYIDATGTALVVQSTEDSIELARKLVAAMDRPGR